jgi:hypothetical protein
MKASRIADLCLVGALVLGLLAAWSTATPQPLTASQTRGAGACLRCYDVGPKDYECDKVRSGCTGKIRQCKSRLETPYRDCSWVNGYCSGGDPYCPQVSSATSCP